MISDRLEAKASLSSNKRNQTIRNLSHVKQIRRCKPEMMTALAERITVSFDVAAERYWTKCQDDVSFRVLGFHLRKNCKLL
jgi:hypothetical protein